MSTEKHLTGPVAVTGADGHVGRTVRRHLAEHPNEVIALTGEGDWGSAADRADALIHLAGTLQPTGSNTYDAANVGTVQRWLDGLRDRRPRRVVFLSYVGADPSSSNDYLRTKGEAERLLERSGIPATIVRSTFIYGNADEIGPSFASYVGEPGAAVSVIGDGRQRIAPIHVDDLAHLLTAAAIDPSTPTGTFEISGPQTVTLDDFVTALNPSGATIRHLPAFVARLAARVTSRLTPSMVEVLLADNVPAGDPIETARLFGVSLHEIPQTLSQEVTR